MILIPLIFCGCERRGVELSEMMIIEGLGIDYTDGEITATAEILNNFGSGTAGGESLPESKSRVFFASGKTISEAVNKIALKCGSEPLYAHTRVVILGENAADKNLADVLDFFERDYNTKPAMLICVAKGCTAGEMLSCNAKEEGIKSELIEDILKTGNEMSQIPRVRVSEAVCVTKEDESSLTLPAVSLIKNDGGDEFMLSGCAVFNKENTVLGYIDENMSSALLFLGNKVNKGSFTAALSDGAQVSMLIVSSKTKYTVEIKDGITIFNIDVTLRVDLNEFSNGVFEKLSPSLIEKIEASAEKALKNELSDCLSLFYDELSCDALRFTKMLSLKKPRYFKHLSDGEREDILNNLAFNVSTAVTIRRTGDEGFDFS